MAWTWGDYDVDQVSSQNLLSGCFSGCIPGHLSAPASERGKVRALLSLMLLIKGEMGLSFNSESFSQVSACADNARWRRVSRYVLTNIILLVTLAIRVVTVVYCDSSYSEHVIAILS